MEADNSIEDREPIQFAPGDDEKWRPTNPAIRQDIDGITLAAWIDR
ncbi:hypothetical protein [Mycobacterium marinum]|nr:hypothetical protein [Mycobacterium marinum]QQW33207.1 hypothetical protein HXW97_04665 [Mycobacterium marinum]